VGDSEYAGEKKKYEMKEGKVGDFCGVVGMAVLPYEVKVVLKLLLGLV
jgi:hypothetical protein